MLETWQFIDPKLAQKYTTLNTELHTLQQQRTKILTNPKLNQLTRSKLLSYNDQCIKNINTLLHKQKEMMVSYFDKQVNVLTKQQIKQKYYKQKQVQIQEIDLSSQMTVRTKCHRKNGKSNFNENENENGNDNYTDNDTDNMDKNQTISTWLNRTRVAMNQSSEDVWFRNSEDGRNRKNGRLSQQQKYNNKHNQQQQYSLQQLTYKPNKKKKASSQRATIKRLKTRCRAYKRRAQFFHLTNKISEMSSQTNQQELQHTISTLKNRIHQLQLSQTKLKAVHSQQISQIRGYYNERLKKIADDYNELSKIKEVNKYLGIKRKQLLREIL